MPLPFLIPAITTGISLLSKLGGPASGAAKGSADQRTNENMLRLQQQGLDQSGARDQFSANLASQNFNVGEQERIKRNQILRSLLGGMQDASITPGNPAIAARMPQMTGGARPSALTANKDILMQMLESTVGNAPPQYTPAPRANLQGGGKGESILGALGIGGSLLGALSPFLKNLGKGSGGGYTSYEGED